VVGRLKEMATKVFGVEPIVISMPYQDTISPADNQANHITYLMVSTDKSKLDAIRKQFAAHGNNFWINWRPE
jgi:hypothetical protein